MSGAYRPLGDAEQGGEKLSLYANKSLAAVLAGSLAVLLLTGCIFVATWPSKNASPSNSLLPRPDHTDPVRLARWLVHAGSWGVLSTTSVQYSGEPFGSIVSYADGPASNPTGRLLFYLTTMDPAAADAAASPAVSLSVTELQLPGSCQHLDAQDPPCAKLTVGGRLLRVPDNGTHEAEALLFPRHPAMKSWPAGHAFELYELHIERIQLLAWYGGAVHVTPQDYFALEP